MTPGQRLVIRYVPIQFRVEQIRYGYELAMEMCMEIRDHDEMLLQRRYSLDLVKSGNSNSVEAVA